MKRWLIDAMAMTMAVFLAVCMPTTEKQKKQTTQAAKDIQEIVPQSIGGASDKVPNPSVMPVAVVSIYHGKDPDSLAQGMDLLDTKGLDTQLLVDKLIEYGVLTQDTKVLSFDIQSKEEDSVGILDLNRAESAEGVSGEISLTGIGNTFTENSELRRPKLKVNGGSYQGSGIGQGGNDLLSYRTDYDSTE